MSCMLKIVLLILGVRIEDLLGFLGLKYEGSTERCTVTTRNLISEVQNFQHYICFKDKCRILCAQGCNYCRLVASDSSMGVLNLGRTRPGFCTGK